MNLLLKKMILVFCFFFIIRIIWITIHQKIKSRFLPDLINILMKQYFLQSEALFCLMNIIAIVATCNTWNHKYMKHMRLAAPVSQNMFLRFRWIYLNIQSHGKIRKTAFVPFLQVMERISHGVLEIWLQSFPRKSRNYFENHQTDLRIHQK